MVPTPPLPVAELSSVASSLAELAHRVQAMAQAAAPEDAEDGVTSDLWEIERTLRSAQRRLATLAGSRSRFPVSGGE